MLCITVYVKKKDKREICKDHPLSVNLPTVILSVQVWYDVAGGGAWERTV